MHKVGNEKIWRHTQVSRLARDQAAGRGRLNFRSRLKFDSYMDCAFNYLIKTVFYGLK
jgi:hypothetical protein